MVTINCGAIPAELVESELFGHAKGAFTGAQTARRGHVASAEGGTLFLDEVGELPMSAQVKLLRLLQQREYTPVGESRAVKCDVRIVAATNRDLRLEVKEGRFREDLFYRLNVIELALPALRERGTDVRVLALHFYRGSVAVAGRTDLRGFSESALRAIEASSWPGNVRALENAIERGVLLARGPFVEAEDILGAGASGPREEAQGYADPRREPQPVAAAASPAPASPGFRANLDLPSDLAVPARAPASPPDFAVDAADGSLGGMGGAPRHGSNPAFPRVLPEQGFDLFSAVESYQNHLIRQALSRTGGNKNKAAQLLGLNRTTLVEMIRRRGI
jgi:transcriptional regulator with GAF, ATPase, and Fis domain